MRKKSLSLVLALAMCLGLAVPALAAGPSAGKEGGIAAPETVTITGMTAQEAPVLDAGGWWVKRVCCESGATIDLKDSYIDRKTRTSIYKVDSIEVFYMDPYLCTNIEYSEEGQTLPQGASAFPLEDGEWLIEVLGNDAENAVEGYEAYFPLEYIYVKVGGSSAPSVSFTDVPADAWYAEAVNWAVEKSVTVGTGENTFSPDSDCTRGEIITFLWRAAGRLVPAWRPGLPTDMGEDEFYSAPVQWAAVTGLFSGDAFQPNAPCTRAMVVDFLWRYAGCPEAAPTGQFTDVPANASYAQAVAWAVEKGVTAGTSATTFSPDSVCTRGQIVTFLYRALA